MNTTEILNRRLFEILNMDGSNNPSAGAAIVESYEKVKRSLGK